MLADLDSLVVTKEEFDAYLEVEKDAPIVKLINQHPPLLDILQSGANRLCNYHGWKKIEDTKAVNMLAVVICAANGLIESD